MKKHRIVLSIVIGSFSGTASMAGCDITKGGAKSAFDGSSLNGIVVKKEDVQTLNKAYPGLNVTEKVFTGSIQTCTDCKDNFVSCS